MFKHNVQTMTLISQAVPGGAKIQQLDIPIFRNKNIIRRYIPMDNSFCMNLRQCIHDRKKYIFNLSAEKFSSLSVQILLKTFPFHIIHNKIGGSILLKITMDTNNTGIPNKFCQSLCLRKKAFFSILEMFSFLSIIGGHGI